MFKRFASIALYTFALALFLYPAAARADSIPTITITSGSVSAYSGPDCLPASACVDFSNAIANFRAYGFDVSEYAFQASVGYSFESQGGYSQFVTFDNYQNGSLIVGGISYPSDYFVRVTGADFIVPSSGTVEVPAVLTGEGTACSVALPVTDSDCSPYPGIPNATVIANINLDIPGYVTVSFSEFPINGNVLYSEVFTAAPEPSSGLFLLTACSILIAWRCGRGLLHLLKKLAQNGHSIKRATRRNSEFLPAWWHAAVPFALWR
ncbi:MAG: hypothetical protein WA324_06625 [Bryobacteraceae bacterium]